MTGGFNGEPALLMCSRMERAAKEKMGGTRQFLPTLQATGGGRLSELTSMFLGKQMFRGRR